MLYQEAARAAVDREMEGYRQRQGWRPVLDVVGSAAAVLGAISVFGGPLGPVAAEILLFPTFLISGDIIRAVTESREDRFRRDLEVAAGLRAPAPSLRERLGRLLGRVGERIADRARSDLDSGVWGRSPTVYYELSGNDARPVTPQRAQELRATSPALTQVSLRPGETLVSSYSSGRLAGRDGGPAAVRLGVDGEVAGAAWTGSRREVRPGLIASNMRQFRPRAAAEAVVASLRGAGRPREVHRREVAVDTVIWEARRVAEAVLDLRLPRAEEDRAIEMLRQIEGDGLALRRAGCARIDLEIGTPLDILAVADDVRSLRESVAPSSESSPRRR